MRTFVLYKFEPYEGESEVANGSLETIKQALIEYTTKWNYSVDDFSIYEECEFEPEKLLKDTNV